MGMSRKNHWGPRGGGGGRKRSKKTYPLVPVVAQPDLVLAVLRLVFRGRRGEKGLFSE